MLDTAKMLIHTQGMKVDELESDNDVPTLHVRNFDDGELMYIVKHVVLFFVNVICLGIKSKDDIRKWICSCDSKNRESYTAKIPVNYIRRWLLTPAEQKRLKKNGLFCRFKSDVLSTMSDYVFSVLASLYKMTAS
jgi:hypothetical protein